MTVFASVFYAFEREVLICTVLLWQLYLFPHFENESCLFLHMNSCCGLQPNKQSIHSCCSLKKIKYIFFFLWLFSFVQMAFALVMRRNSSWQKWFKLTVSMKPVSITHYEHTYNVLSVVRVNLTLLITIIIQHYRHIIKHSHKACYQTGKTLIWIPPPPPCLHLLSVMQLLLVDHLQNVQYVRMLKQF